MKAMTLQIVNVKGKKPHLRLVGANGELILAGEPRSRLSGVKLTASRVKAAGLIGFKIVEVSK